MPNQKIIQNINLHIHYLTDYLQITTFANLIKDIIKLEYPFFICGDFNKQLSDLESFIDNLQEIKIKEVIEPTSIYKPCFTSFDTRKSISNGIKLYSDKDIYLAIIDYILIGGNNIKYKIPPQIISQIDDYYIFYDLKAIHTLLIPLLDQNINIVNKWSELRNKKDISDHKPIMSVIQI